MTTIAIITIIIIITNSYSEVVITRTYADSSCASKAIISVCDSLCVCVCVCVCTIKPKCLKIKSPNLALG